MFTQINENIINIWYDFTERKTGQFAAVSEYSKVCTSYLKYILSNNINNTCLVILIESISKHKFSINYSRNLASSTSRSCNKN